jgi:hypothetical protein
MAEVQQRVLAESGVALHPETRLVGFAPGPDDPEGQVEVP